MAEVEPAAGRADLAGFDGASPPPGWVPVRGFACSCVWRTASVPGWLELVSWDQRCRVHPVSPSDGGT
jgi:hypothetical protein